MTAAATLLAGAALFAVLATVAATAGAPLPGDRDLIGWLQEPGWLRPIARWADRPGDVQFLTLALAWIATAAAVRGGGPPREGVVFAMAAFLAAGVLLSVDQELKPLIGSPRPAAADGVAIYETSGTHGFPSGHTFAATLVFGLAAAVVGRYRPRAKAPVIAAAVALAFLGGLARVVLGAHWPSDVAGGWVLGVAGIGACLLAGEGALAIRRRVANRAPAR